MTRFDWTDAFNSAYVADAGNSGPILAESLLQKMATARLIIQPLDRSPCCTINATVPF